jgi:hypothetical protein
MLGVRAEHRDARNIAALDSDFGEFVARQFR